MRPTSIDPATRDHGNHDLSRITVLVATPLGKGGMGGIDRLMDQLRVRVDEAREDGVELRFGVTRGKGHIALSPFYLVGFFLLIFWQKISGRIDLLHLNVASNGSFKRKSLIAGFARFLQIPYVVHLHGGLFREFYSNSSEGRQSDIRKLFERAAGVIVLGSPWRDFVLSIAPGADIHILPNATRALTAGNRDGKTIEIAFLGRIGPKKGTQDLLAAAARISATVPWRLTLAGDGEVDEARQQVSALGLGDRVSLPGWLGEAASENLLERADIVVLPSYIENLPLSVIEGMGAGAAVVATPVGAVTDILTNEVNGLIVQPGDVEGLAAALDRLIGDPELRDRLGENARSTHREMLDIRSYLPRLAVIWKEALANASLDKKSNLNS